MSNKTEYGNNMLIHTSYWGEHKTFKMMPVTTDCPFVEAIYDRRNTLLVVIGKTPVEKYQLVPSLDDDGEPIKAKKPKSNGKAHRESRAKMNLLHEHYITEREEIVNFVKQFGVNSDMYEYDKWIRDLEEEAKAIVQPEAAPLMDSNGTPLTK